MKKLQLLIIAILPLFSLAQTPNPICLKVEVSGYSDSYLDSIQSGFEQRRNAILLDNIANPYPPYSTPIVTSQDAALFLWNKETVALASFMLNANLVDANEGLRAAIDTLISHPDWLLASNGFHWRAPILGRIWERFQTDTNKLEVATRSRIEQINLDWINGALNQELSDTSLIWAYWGSENHHHMRHYAAWQACKILKDGPHASTMIDGLSISAHFDRLNEYMKLFYRLRISHGGFVEHGSYTYSKYTLQGLYNFFDFGDTDVRHIAKAALDSWWACYGLENLDFISGGAKNRIYQDQIEAYTKDGSTYMIHPYTGAGIAHRHPAYSCLMTSDYRLPSVVLDLMLDNRSLGPYPLLNTKVARLSSVPPPGPEWRMLDPDSDSTIHRYTYVSNNFVMGTNYVPYISRYDWAPIAAQNRMNSVIFSGNPNSRLLPLVSPIPGGNQKVYNAEYSAQYLGTMITRKIHDDYTGNSGETMRVYFSDDLIVEEQAPASKDSWIFVQADQAYAAVRGMHGSYSWDDSKYIRFSVDTTPVIIQVAEQSEFSDYTAFKQAVLNQTIIDTNSVLSFNSLLENNPIQFSYGRTGQTILGEDTVKFNSKFNQFSQYVFCPWANDHFTIQKSGRRLKPVINGFVEEWIDSFSVQIYQDVGQGYFDFRLPNHDQYKFSLSVEDTALISEDLWAMQVLSSDSLRLYLNSTGNETGIGKVYLSYDFKSSVETIDSNLGIHVYPNPFHHQLNIAFDDADRKVAYAILRTVQGKMVLKHEFSAYERKHLLNLKHIPQGIYFLEFYNDQSEPVAWEKIIKR